MTKIENTEIAKAALPRWYPLVWGTRAIYISVTAVMLGYTTYFSTNYLGLSPALVGTLMMVSKIFDGFTDLCAGFLIDHTNTRLGKARPYDLSSIFLCLLTIALFAVPQISMPATAAYVFVVYTLIFSVFSTLQTCAEPVYLARAVPNDGARVKLLLFAGVVSVLAGMGAAILLPQVIATVGATREGWFKISLFLVVPCLFLSLIRFFLIKERAESSCAKQTSFSIREGAAMLFHNKYILLFALVLLLANIGGNMNQVAVYYFTYVVGDLSKQSFVAIGSLLAPVILIITPLLEKRFGLINVMRAALLLGAVGYLLPLFAPTSIPVLMLAVVFSSSATIPLFILAGAVVINCMDYGEWKYGKRGEGIYTCVIGFTSKVGMGLGAALIGGVMALGGFDAALPQQTAATGFSIQLLYTAIPSVLMLCAVIALSFYNLEKQLPKIQSELAERRANGSV